ncbi:NAD kinase [Pseudoclavibacter caeni]|jgi:NAD+ kinase|uniref:NAD kinase n=1 Tax=Pseudoclavibacter caeni TaxID=908846 RepID=A0A7C8FQV5_9MICO|nr:NAD kinase [Pseudoclavibacter caeni]KAB1633047.1 NAD kinase [Pseudoclavibacter caeni]NYJ96965.1 NAD+ kinase [Pseudoclavibacter caeni]
MADETRRRVLLVVHPRREVALKSTMITLRLLREAGLVPVLAPDGVEPLRQWGVDVDDAEVLGVDCTGPDLEIVMVLGGDGTILRAAELVRFDATPIIGVNLGHVGFLAESERDDLVQAVSHVVRRAYEVERRMALTVRVSDGDRLLFQDWALNEVTIEKPRSNKMITVDVSINGRPFTAFGCDGVMVSTPTGSTAYAFSAGGPIVWPNLEALLFVPLNAHALFARPLVIAPHLTVDVQLSDDADGAVTWCDGRRSQALPPGARVQVSRSAIPVRLARLRTGSFVDRLVNKFELPSLSWQQGAEQRHGPGAQPAPTGRDALAAETIAQREADAHTAQDGRGPSAGGEGGPA